ncbi:MAG: DUF2203 domain-containing protein, partial [Bdellovibrionales bacterium]|nr:DUF2203 domain-containing protein [Bdellovibrionales bacterium]
HRKGTFTLTEARELLPIVRRITQEHSQKAELLISRLEALPITSELIENLESQVNHIIAAWHAKIKKLGALPKGLWMVDFDAGDGYYCWKFPEKEICHWHSYEDGFTKRVRISERHSLTASEDLLSDMSRSHIMTPL